MHSQRRRQGGLSNDVCLIILTVLVVISLFFFVLVLSHESLGSGDAHANKLIKWTVSYPHKIC
jgi:preprotein translocase subunit SecG